MPKQSRTVTFNSKSTTTERTRRTAQIGKAYLWRPLLYRTDLAHTTKLVAMWLYDHCKPGTYIATGWAETIAQDLGMSPITVKSAIKELRKFKIIMTVNQHHNHRGGVFNAYTMRQYDDDQPRRKLLKVTKPTKADKPAKPPITHQPEQNQASVPSEKEVLQLCVKCNGTKWVYDNQKRASSPCPDCRKPKSRVKI